jgi:hypothetical protein
VRGIERSAEYRIAPVEQQDHALLMRSAAPSGLATFSPSLENDPHTCTEGRFGPGRAQVSVPRPRGVAGSGPQPSVLFVPFCCRFLFDNRMVAP